MSQPMTVTFEQDGREIKVVQHTQKYTHVTVSSSKPDHEPYDVVVRPDTIRCACRGNLFRGHCSHSDAVRAVINRTA